MPESFDERIVQQVIEINKGLGVERSCRTAQEISNKYHALDTVAIAEVDTVYIYYDDGDYVEDESAIPPVLNAVLKFTSPSIQEAIKNEGDLFLQGSSAIVDGQGKKLADIPDGIKTIIQNLLDDEDIKEGIIDIEKMPVYREGNSVEWYFVDTQTEGDDPYYIGL